MNYDEPSEANEYANLEEDVQMLWGMLRAILADGLQFRDFQLIATTLMLGIQGLSSYLDETNPAEKKRYALALVDGVYDKQIKPMKLSPWPPAEEKLDEALGKMIHWAASEILDKLLAD